jgi:hypothetical protein
MDNFWARLSGLIKEENYAAPSEYAYLFKQDNFN